MSETTTNSPFLIGGNNIAMFLVLGTGYLGLGGKNDKGV